MNSRPKVPWSRGDKFLMFLLGLILPIILGLFFWSRALDRNPDVSVPTPAMPATNARDYYIAASKAVVDEGKIEDARASLTSTGRLFNGKMPPSLADKEKLVAENAGAVKTLHTGFQYPYQETPYRSFNAPFPHYQKIRALARFLSLEGQVDAERGDWKGAMSADLDAIQIGEQLPHGGPLIGMLVGDACQANGRQHSWAAVDHLDADQTRAAAARLKAIRAGHVPFADVLQEEEWAHQAGLLEMMRRRDWPGDMLAGGDPQAGGDPHEDGTSAFWQVTAARIRLTGKRAIMANYTRYTDESIANARRPYAARPPAPEFPNDPMSQLLLPVFAGVQLSEVNADTQNALLLTTLALHAYKLDHGAYPATLSALTPRYLQSIPTDPFALSGPLRYKPRGARYQLYSLYSVGPDGRDDGGKAIFDPTKLAPKTAGGSDRRREVQENSEGDIVAGVNMN